MPRIYDRTLGVPVLMLLIFLVAADSTMAQPGTPVRVPGCARSKRVRC